MSHPWMPFYIADYLADTTHLSTVEHGAYMLLILDYWQHGGLPGDSKRMARICRMTQEEWLEIRDTIAELFGPDWTHGRIDKELAKAEALTSKRSQAGKAGASARYGKGVASASQTDAQLHSPSPKEDKNYSSNGKKAETDAMSARLASALKPAEKKGYMTLKSTDSRRPNAEEWWFKHYGTRDLPWRANGKGMVCQVPWEAVVYPIPPPSQSSSEFIPTPPRNAA